MGHIGCVLEKNSLVRTLIRVSIDTNTGFTIQVLTELNIMK